MSVLSSYGIGKSSITRTVAPDGLPVDEEEITTYLRADSTELKNEAKILVARATAYVEDYQWSQLLTATFAERFDRFHDVIQLMKSPVQSVTSVQYVDTNGTTQTLTASTDYTADVYAKPARIVPAYSKWWPTTRGFINDVIVTYIAGYGTAADVPLNIRQAILMLASHWLEFHGAVDANAANVDFSVKALLDQNSFRTFY